MRAQKYNRRGAGRKPRLVRKAALCLSTAEFLLYVSCSLECIVSKNRERIVTGQRRVRWQGREKILHYKFIQFLKVFISAVFRTYKGKSSKGQAS